MKFNQSGFNLIEVAILIVSASVLLGVVWKGLEYFNVVN
jgi:hypothetical protein